MQPMSHIDYPTMSFPAKYQIMQFAAIDCTHAFDSSTSPMPPTASRSDEHNANYTIAKSISEPSCLLQMNKASTFMIHPLFFCFFFSPPFYHLISVDLLFHIPKIERVPPVRQNSSKKNSHDGLLI